MCIEDGLLADLEGAPCFVADCTGADRTHGVLGPLTETQTCDSRDVSYDTVWYRCKACQKKRSVLTGSSLFRSVGGNVKSLSFAVLSMWNCVQGADFTYTFKQLVLDKQIVGRYYRTARKIMAWDAERRQSEFVFGCLPHGQTADVEADEACFFHIPRSWA